MNSLLEKGKKALPEPLTTTGGADTGRAREMNRVQLRTVGSGWVHPWNKERIFLTGEPKMGSVSLIKHGGTELEIMRTDYGLYFLISRMSAAHPAGAQPIQIGFPQSRTTTTQFNRIKSPFLDEPPQCRPAKTHVLGRFTHSH